MIKSLSLNILRARSFFAALHRGQTRRDGERPYFVHLEAVANKVSSVVEDENLIIAAYGHDSVEDQDVDVQLLIDKFGTKVAYLIIELSDVFTKKNYPNLNRAVRKDLERKRYAQISDEAALLKLADIHSNLEDLDYEDIGFSRMFAKEKRLCLPYLARTGRTGLENKWLYIETEAVLEKAEKQLDIYPI